MSVVSDAIERNVAGLCLSQPGKVATERAAQTAFGIIIVSFNTRKLTLACLQSLRKHEPQASVVVVDNASHDGSADAIAAEFPEAKLLRLEHNLGFGRANTLAMKFLSEDIVILLNSDTVVTDDSLRRCAAELLPTESERNPPAAVTPRLIGINGEEQNTRHAVPTFSQTLQRALWRRPMASTPDDFWIPGTCMVLNRAAVEAAGGLFSPELFIYWEDADLCSRLKASGYTVDVVEDASVIHHGGASGGGPNCTAKSGLHEWYTFGRHFWFRRHRPHWEAVSLWLLEFVDAFRCMSRAIVRPSRRLEFQYGRTLLKTLVRKLFGRTPTFAVPVLHGRWDVDLVSDADFEPAVSVTDATRSGSPRPRIESSMLIGGNRGREAGGEGSQAFGEASNTCAADKRRSSPGTLFASGVVIIGRNEGERLKRSLLSVEATKVPFIYVDSGSTDGSQKLAQELGAELLELDLSTPFTAARARMAGLHCLLKQNTQLDTVQFLDGDCELNPNWLASAHATLAADQECAIVCGVLQERAPEQSVYNRLCQLEWRRPTGHISSCGGIFLARTEAMIQSGGFDTTLIAGEEPELCVRLRAQSWNIQAIAAPMAKHDAAMTSFGQWWKRSIRAGLGYAQGYAMHGHRPERFRRREVRSIVFYGLAAPALAVATAWHTLGLSLAIMTLIYLRLYRRVRDGRIANGDFPSDAAVYSRFVVLGKFAQAIGVLRFHTNRLLSRRQQLIEYKSPAGARS